MVLLYRSYSLCEKVTHTTHIHTTAHPHQLLHLRQLLTLNLTTLAAFGASGWVRVHEAADARRALAPGDKRPRLKPKIALLTPAPSHWAGGFLPSYKRGS